jgi:hypothetical protein
MANGVARGQLDRFIDKYSPEIRALARAVLARMRARLPGAVELVYDNYNALVIGFGPTERPSEAILSIVLYPRWVSLCFLNGAKLPDPHKLLKGSGTKVRHLLVTFRITTAPDPNAQRKEAAAGSLERGGGKAKGRRAQRVSAWGWVGPHAQE